MARKWIVLALAAVMLVSSAALLNRIPVQPMGLPEGFFPHGEDEDAAGPARRISLALSETGHFYNDSIDIVITASDPKAKIYYTTDGSEPTRASREYSQPISFLRPMRGLNVVTLKVIAYNDTVSSRMLAHTYFISRDIGERFDTLVFSISTNDEYLYDYDDGLFVAGRTRREYMQDNPGRDYIPPDPANFNWRGMDGERPAYAEVFTPDGTRVVAQGAGIRVHGGWSRAVDQKSIRLVARREYEPDAGRFDFDFFPDDVRADRFGSPITRYDQIILRNGANDRDFGMLRHEVGTHLARQAGFRVATDARPAAVFVNGVYHGFAWLQIRINGHYLQDVYSAPTRDFQIVGRGELWVVTDDEAERAAIDHMNSFLWRDLTNDRIFAEFEQLVDIDNMLLYYAIQTYMGNHDWPGGNMRRWRYTGPQTEGLAPELDGRWRYVLYDMDWTLGLYDHPVNPNKPSLDEMLNENHNRRSYLLMAVLAREDMQDKFAMMMCDLAANVITTQNVRDAIDHMYGMAYNEIGFALNANKYSGWTSRHSIRENHDNMVAFARSRAGYIFQSLRRHFDFGQDMFDVAVEGGEAIIGTQKGVSSRYFSRLTVPLRPALPGNAVFDHWVVNGEKIYDEEITVSDADARLGTVRVELVSREIIPQLEFESAAASSARNGCVLVNNTPSAVRTAGMYLSNDPDNPFLWALPDANVRPGEKLEFAGKGSAGMGDLLRIQMGFAVRAGRVLYLSDAEGNLIDFIAVR
jgi:hypothetical protein